MVAQKQNVIVFGGAFSPPTLAHEALLRECLALPGFDEVWLLPSGNRTDKHISVTHAHQLAMLGILRDELSGNGNRLRIDTTEVERTLSTETDDTYRELTTKYPAVSFRFVYGADSYETIRTWQNGSWLASHLPVLIAPRNGAALPKPNSYIEILQSLPLELQHISSTAARAALERGEDVTAFVSPAIAQYISSHNLFV
ncbi:nicotinate-nicotinamide nucleotide adenylyltransferase [Candidatus Saccharibacteria bacterium]|nr:MAG: nicotinate-nicotinamide nucleotide adenylyltransferase [Candidatus Saccharibacteria bacterium]